MVVIHFSKYISEEYTENRENRDSIKEKEFKCFKNHLEADDLEILVPWGFIPAVMPKNGSPTFTHMQPQ